MVRRHYIVIVDDDTALAEMYRLGLEGEGFKVAVVSDAMNLNEVVETQHPDAIVLDWELPGVRGDQALERLRRTDAGVGVPVFMLSNFPGTSDGTIDRVFEFGAIAWFEKVNTTPARLATSLREALGGTRSPKGD